MAYITGTAADKGAIWDVLLDFLQNNPDLVAANENWENVWVDPSGDQKKGIVLKGPGASGDDAILVGLTRVDSDVDDQNCIYINGMTGVINGAPTLATHLNTSGYARIFLDAHPMQYWIVASGRRFIMVVKISTTYQAMYGGFVLPYANPLAYPYPMMIGASAPDFNGPTNWRSTDGYHTHFCIPVVNGNQPPRACAQAYFCDPNGSWLAVGNQVKLGPASYDTFDEAGNNNWGFIPNQDQFNVMGYRDIFNNAEPSPGGGYALDPWSIIQSSPSMQNYGIIDGCFHVPGQSNAVENILQIDGVDYLVVQNVFRTGVDQYWAMRLN